MKPNFKEGDSVRCIDPPNHIEKGIIVKVLKVYYKNSRWFCKFDGCAEYEGWFCERFEKINTSWRDRYDN